MNSPKIESRIRAVLAARPSSSVLPTLGVAALALLAMPALAALRPGQASRSPEERTETLKRMKAVAIGTILYTQDYDERLPYANSTAVAAKEALPYARGGARKGSLNVSDDELFRSATPGGRFFFNTKLSGLPFNQIAEPAGTLAWYETVPDATAPVAVAYVDGHVRIERPERRDALRAKSIQLTTPRRDPRIATPVSSSMAEAQARLTEAQARLQAARAQMDRAVAEAVRARAQKPRQDPEGHRRIEEKARRMAALAELDRRNAQADRARSLSLQRQVAKVQAELAMTKAHAAAVQAELARAQARLEADRVRKVQKQRTPTP